jgi:transcriptional regulator of NAD metabolism
LFFLVEVTTPTVVVVPQLIIKGSLILIGATSLSSLTGGVHLHTIYADSTEILHRIEEALKENGFLLK